MKPVESPLRPDGDENNHDVMLLITRFAVAIDGFVESWPLFIYSLTSRCSWRLLNEWLCWGVNCTLQHMTHELKALASWRKWVQSVSEWHGPQLEYRRVSRFSPNAFHLVSWMSLVIFLCFLLALNHTFSSLLYLLGPKSTDVMGEIYVFFSVKPRPFFNQAPPLSLPSTSSAQPSFMTHPLHPACSAPVRPRPLESQSPPFSISPTLLYSLLVIIALKWKWKYGNTKKKRNVSQSVLMLWIKCLLCALIGGRLLGLIELMEGLD